MNDFETLKKIVDAPAIEPYIRHIRFPRYRRLTPGSRINFTYPITALVGSNGTNKSSILRALQGCPQGANVGDYWFETDLDHIGDPREKDPLGTHRYIHGYNTDSGRLAEVIKLRVGKESRGFDYFETRAPTREDGMVPLPQNPQSGDKKYLTKTRWKPIDKSVVYLDFRQEIAAYDKKFFFDWRLKDNSIAQKKARIRKYAKYVSEALSEKKTRHIFHRKNRITKAAEELSSSELKIVSRILGRTYSKIELVEHDYFDVVGYTARLSTAGHNYSEAYAGSGEFAAITLVRAISRAKNNSLILLDEPETSLHPGAQRELMKFIAHECVTKHHQVVVATHAPAIVEQLPDDARKLLFINVEGTVDIINNASRDEAFYRLGATISPNTIYVEDDLAKHIVEYVARKFFDSSFASTVNVEVFPNGAQTILTKLLPVLSQENSSTAILLDGDQEPKEALRSSDAVASTKLDNELDKIQPNLTRSILKKDQSAKAKVLDWAREHVFYLPPSGSNPETLLMAIVDKDHLARTNEDAKAYWRNTTLKELNRDDDECVDASEILGTQKRALARADTSNCYLEEIAETLREIRKLQ